MRTLTSISLLLILLLNLFGFYVAFIVKQDVIQREMSELVKDKKQTAHQVVTLCKHDFENIKWITEGKEFRLKGKLYDVSKIEFLNGVVKLFVEEDSLETNLVEDFISIINSQTEKEQNNSPLKLLLEHFLKEFTVEKTSFIFHSTVSFISVVEKDFLFTSFISNQQSPPPDLV